MSPEEQDKFILALAQPQWRKVSFIVAAVGATMVALVKAGKLEAQGDLSEWRRSEVRLPKS
jgi:hypothetical protein